MAIINEVGDTDINMTVGDTYNGGVAGADTRDVMIFNGLQVGTTYTVTIDLTSIADTVEIGILNLYAQGTRYFIVNGVLAPASVPDAGFASFSPGELNGLTLSFNITVAQAQVMGLEFTIHNGGSTNYSISLTEYVAPPLITEGADIILGDNDANLIDALGGDDSVDGAGGNDTLDGAAGNDTLTGGAGADLFVIGLNGGVDTITDFTRGADRIDLLAHAVHAIEDLTLVDGETGVTIDFGDGHSVTLTGVLAADLDNADFLLATNAVTGTSLDENLVGKSGVDHLYGGDGRDKLEGRDGDDLLVGEAGNDLLQGGAGNDTLDGGANNDRLYGGDGDDVVWGGAGNDQLYGDDGADSLSGGTGKDQLFGGAGADVFVFEAGSNRDIIQDYTDGEDRIDLSGWVANGITDFGVLDIRDMGADALIFLAPSNTITLLGVDAAVLDASDFIF